MRDSPTKVAYGRSADSSYRSQKTFLTNDKLQQNRRMNGSWFFLCKTSLLPKIIQTADEDNGTLGVYVNAIVAG